MARQIPSGTPSKSSRHIFPDDSRRILYLSLMIGGGLLAALAVLYAFGARRVVSPGDVAAAHSHIDAKCSLCHDEGRSLLPEAALSTAGNDLRCERCHDPAGAGRLANASHVLLGSGDPVKAAGAPELACAQCHVDHRGTRFPLRDVDDRECAACHKNDFTGALTMAPLTSFAGHPELAAFKAKRTTGVGLLFNHVTHFDYVLRERRRVKDVSAAEAQKGSAETCDRCHAATRDRREFVPVSFDTGCAGSMCHTDQGGLINEGTRDVTLAFITPNVPGVAQPAGDGDDQVKVFTGFRHRDEWLQSNAAWLRASLDPEGAAAERAAMGSLVAWLDQQATPPPWQAATVEDLTRWRDALTREISDLDARIASAGQPSGEMEALARDAADIQNLLTELSPGAPADPPVTRRLEGSDGPPAGVPDDNPEALFESRRRELLNLLGAIRARAESAGDTALRDRAAALETRVTQARPGTGQPTPDLAALRADLTALDDVVRAVRQANDAQAREELAALQALRELTVASGLGGLPAAEFEQRRQEILRLLDVVARVGAPELQERVAALRGRLASLQAGSGNAGDLTNRRAERQRVLGRVRVELELAGSPDRATPLPVPGRDDTARRLADETRRTLARLDLAAAAPPASEADRFTRQQTLAALLAPCLKCHLYDGEDENRVNPVTGKDDAGSATRTIMDALSRTGLRLARVSAAEPVMKRALFAHGPHVVAADCASCHASVGGSTLGIDFNSPGVATCQSCHRSGAARTSCAGCHIYHPSSSGRLLQSVWSAN